MMNNIYNDHLERLRSINVAGAPAISMYIPLKWVDCRPDQIFFTFLRTADKLLLRGGHSRLLLSSPPFQRWQKRGATTLALFHHAGMTDILPLPTRMQPRLVVANSFHVKPLVTAAEEYVDALLLHFHQGGACLYRVSPGGEMLLDNYLPSEVIPKFDWPSRMEKGALREFLDFLGDEVRGSRQLSTMFLGVSGAAFSQLNSHPTWELSKIPVVSLEDRFNTQVPEGGFSILRLRLSQIINERHSRKVSEVLRTSKVKPDLLSMRALGAKILNKEINHLCVSLDHMVFGEVDFETGEVRMNRTQKDSRDDDLLDDLIELAIDRGIKVSVVPKKFLPSGRHFIAS